MPYPASDALAPGPRSAVLLLGPTGAGKSPLGDWLERRGWVGRRCLHFDFGANLRRVAEDAAFAAALPAGDVATVKRVLSTGALLEDDEFHIALAILGRFAEEKSAGARDSIVLNGLPRHVGQAQGLAPVLNVVLVVSLRCPAEVVRERIRRNSGGDRKDRVDDAPEKVENKLRLFEERTRPLLEFYRARGARMVAVDVGLDTQPEDIARQLPSAELP